ncbi:GGDEF domain-containing protein [Halarcobacter sp.]|uniref:transporter substrate-binding domain-containing diguanylate cyclase n=1 Tax=Halarcobacter sp. TaxID=2321133 RepID=UPI002AA86DB3|nr:GGDEF domain-containing protein [Halarcobacter sp.]
MKKILLVTFLLLFPSFLLSYNEKVYKVVIRKDWKPYYFINKNGKPDGFAIELFEKVAKKAKIKYKYIIIDDLKEIMSFFKDEKVDILPSIGISSNRKDLFLFTQPTDSFLVNIYKNKSSKNISDLKDIKGKSIGLVVDNICGQLIDKNLYNRYFYHNYNDLITALNNGQIDAFCYPKPLIERKLDLNENIVSLNKSLKEIKRAIGISKQNFHLLPIFNDALTELKLTGELDNLTEKWFDKHNYIELTKNETIFLILSFIGISFTILVVIFYILSKKRWLVTKDMLEEEIRKKTNALMIQNKRLKNIHRKLKEQSNIDPLTKVYNRKFYNEKIKELLSLYNRYENTFTYLMFDIDDFKKINDIYGHIIGDEVLIKLSNIVSEKIRINDYFFRIGGEEFVILLSDTSLEESKTVACKIKDSISEEIKILDSLKVTISVGLTEVKKDDVEESIYKRADKNMYKAKNSGKNRVICEDDSL